MNTFYTNELHTEILIALLKAHNIKKIIASPGTTNITLMASIQHDPFFEVYSSVDERSAAYIACGMAAESGEPVALSCTGATASRNYVSGLTEAFYRKLPILAITSSQHLGRIGQNMPQVIDRTVQMKDITKMSIQVSPIYTDEDAWAVNVAVNNALLELRHNGGGPVHINLTTTYSKDYSVKTLPKTRVISRICYSDKLPQLPNGKIGIYIGAHKKWSPKLTSAVEHFCELYNGVVFCDQTSNYKGRYRVYPSLVCSQTSYTAKCRYMDLMIHIGDVSGSDMHMHMSNVWRVNPDGIVRDTFMKLRFVFEMDEVDFFCKYIAAVSTDKKNLSYYNEWYEECEAISNKVPKLPFSNVWIASQTVEKLPKNSVLYAGILNTLRSWNYYKQPESVNGYSNTGGFGIDGGISTLVGSSLVNTNKLFYCITGDLAFFYDLNVIGNRHVGNNIRIMLINNGRGTEFTNYNHPGVQFGEDAFPFIAAVGHYGEKSLHLVKHYAQDLGYEYFSASSQEEYLQIVEKFISPEMTEKPVIFEVFTDAKDESDAIEIMHNVQISTSAATKNAIKGIIGEKNVATFKKLIKP